VPDDIVTTALAAARLRAVRLALMALHKDIIDAERLRYERAFGRSHTAQQTLQLLLENPWFAWFRPLATLIVEIDERLDAEEPLDPATVETFIQEVRALLTGARTGDQFRREYHRLLQEAPEVVVSHGRLAKLLERAG
jgi:hypothetical protein